MGWLGLDWGNVPGWFSAGSFMVAGYAIVRDRQQKKRQQVDNVGVWGEFYLSEEVGSVNFGWLMPKIHIKNASNLPAYIEEINYEVVYSWSLKLEAGYFVFPFDAEIASFDGRIHDVVAPPGQEVVTYGVSRRPIDRPQKCGADAGVTSHEPGSRLIVKELILIDNAYRRWRVVPRAGRANAISSAIIPFAASTMGSVNPIALATSDVSKMVSLNFRRLARRLWDKGRSKR